MSYFAPALFEFLRELRANNDRDWFQSNKKRYEASVKEPALSFISDFGPHLHRVSEHFVADPRPVGGSLFRIHRDTRFSNDKSPYKTHTGLHFRHAAGKDAHCPGFYLHLEPGGCFIGMGLWRPPPPDAAKIRQAIAGDPKGYRRAVGGKAFKTGLSMMGEALKRPPRGFDADHPLIEELKRKDFIASANLSDGQITSPALLKEVARACKAGAPLVGFLCRALDVPF